MRKEHGIVWLAFVTSAVVVSWFVGICAVSADETSQLGGCVQVAGTVTFWKYQFKAPHNYWQCPGKVSWHGTAPEKLLVTFFASEDDAKLLQSGRRVPGGLAIKSPQGPVLQFGIGAKLYDRAEDFFKVYDGFPKIRVREIADPLRNRFLQLRNWSCKYIEPTEAYGGFFGIACFSVNQKGVKLSVTADSERKVLDEAQTLWDMAASFKENE